jgi:predicted Zn-dependent peptidase
VLSDILANPSFDAEELEREKSVIEQEIGAAQDTPDDVIFEHLSELCYPDQPLGRSLLGTPQTLASFSRDNLHNYLSTHYHGPDMVLRPPVRSITSRWLRRSNSVRSFASTPAPKPVPAMFGKGGSRVIHRDLEQAHLTLALEGCRSRIYRCSACRCSPTFSAAACHRGCFRKCARSGLCYSIYTFHAAFSDTGFFGSTPAPDPADAPEMMEVIVDEMNNAVETLTEQEISRSKAQMKAGLLMGLESCSARAEQMARHILAYGRPLTVEELVARIDAVSVESTRNAARGLLTRSRPAVVALGDGRGLDTAVGHAEGLARPRARALCTDAVHRLVIA